MIGKTISHYKILDLLGKGGMGVVYKARDLKLDRLVALKFLPPYLSASEPEKQRFILEAKAASALDHPHIGTIHDIDETDDHRLFIAMAHYDGGTLKDRIARGPLPIEQAIEVATQIAEALGQAHAKEIVHRDIKPANILLTDRDRVKIIDFGLAKLAGSSGLTKTHSTMGTAAYMSPEQAQGWAAGHRLDIWALGVVLYEMLTGHRPFQGEFEQVVLYAIVNDEPTPLSALRPDVPPELQALISRCMAKEMHERYQSADELETALREIGGSRGSATKRWRRPPFGSFGGQSWRKISTFALRFLMPVAAAAVLAFLLFSANRTHIDRDRVVVSIFENQTGDDSLDPLGSMATDWIIQGLSEIGSMEVVPPSTVRGMVAGTRTDIGSLSEETGAAIVVSGAYYLTNDSLHFRAEVTDVIRGRLLSSLQGGSGPRSDPTGTIEDLRQRIMGALAVHFDRFGATINWRKPPRYEAYKEYMLGNQLFAGAAAVPYYDKAAELDTTFTFARIWKAVLFRNAGYYAEADSMIREIEKKRGMLSEGEVYWLGWSKGLVRGNWTRALSFARQVAKLDPEDLLAAYGIGYAASLGNRRREVVEIFTKHDQEFEAWYDHVLGRWRFILEATALHALGENSRELEQVRRARTYFPGVMLLLACEVRALAAQRRTQEIHNLIDESLSMAGSPFSVMQMAVKELRAHGDSKSAQGIAERAVDWCKTHGARQDRLATAHYLAGDWQEAYSQFQDLYEKNPGNISTLGSLAVSAARAGTKVEAMRIAAELQKIDRPYLLGQHYLWRARIAAVLGEHEQAIMLLRQAFADGCSHGEFWWLHTDVDFESLRDDPAFQELVRPKG